jgi:hypothetical protein
MEEKRIVYRVLMGKPARNSYLGDGRIILQWIFSKWDVGV